MFVCFSRLCGHRLYLHMHVLPRHSGEELPANAGLSAVTLVKNPLEQEIATHSIILV